MSHGENAVTAARASAAPDFPSHLVALAVVRRLRAPQTGDAPDLNHAVALCREAVEVTPKTSFRVRDRGNSLGIALLERYLAQGSPADLDEALSQLTRLDAKVDPSSKRLGVNAAGLLFNTGNGLWIGYRRTGDLMALDQTIARFTRAVAAVDPAALDGRRFRNSLAVALAERYAAFGNVADLRRAVALLREAWFAASPGSPEWLVYVTNAATAAQILHRRPGKPSRRSATQWRLWRQRSTACPQTTTGAATCSMAWAALWPPGTPTPATRPSSCVPMPACGRRPTS